MQLLLTGGRQRRTLIEQVDDEHRFEKAVALSLDTETCRSRILCEYISPPAAKAHRHSSTLFASSSLKGNRLFACTPTEVFVFKLPEFVRESYVSLPCFNAVHHVCPTREGNVAVANTGLDMVLEMTASGKVLSEWDVLGEDTWSKFHREIDYRRVPSTKPHRSHPNFVFTIGEDLWVTRFHQRDAICLTRTGMKIRLGGEPPHDGIFQSGLLYFTSIDGSLLTVDPSSLEVIRRENLSNTRGPACAPGFCRGVLVVKQLAWVGFTRIRKSAFRQQLVWAKHGFRQFEAPTRIVGYDLTSNELFQEIDLEPHGIDILFGIHLLPQFA